MSGRFVLQTHQLTKDFGSVRALNQVSIGVRRGEIYGFLGPNGAGKTTAIGIMLGLIHPTSGKVRILDQELSPSSTMVLQRVGSLVGSPGLVPHLSGMDNLRLSARLHSKVAFTQIAEVLDRVGLTDAATRRVKGYSNGMKQRLALAAALLHKPELLIMDEPTNGLDPAGMHEVRILLQTLSEAGTTVFLSSHLLNEVEQICDRVTVLNKGKIVAEGAVDELRGDRKVVMVRVACKEDAQRVLEPIAQEVKANGAFLEVVGLSSQSVVAYLSASGIVPSEVTTKRDGLEAIFLELTREAA